MDDQGKKGQEKKKPKHIPAQKKNRRSPTLNRRKDRAERRAQNTALLVAKEVRAVTSQVRKAIKRRGQTPPTARAIVDLAKEKFGYTKDSGSDSALLQAANVLLLRQED